VANLRNHQPRSWTWWLMTILGLYAGLRPQETITLEVGDFTLPDEGYGSVHFTTAWNGAGGEWGTPEEDIGPTKTTRHRTVPLTPYVVCCVREYLEFTGLTEGKMFLTRSGKRPSAANWWRALNSSSTKASVSAAFYPYGLRHFAASHWLASGIEPPGSELARQQCVRAARDLRSRSPRWRGTQSGNDERRVRAVTLQCATLVDVAALRALVRC